MPVELDIRTFCLGPFQTNCHLVRAAGSSDCWVIDAGAMPAPMIQAIEDEGWRPERILLTHAHADHLAGVEDFLKRWPGTPVWLHEAEASYPGDPMQNLSGLFAGVMPTVVAPPPDKLLRGGETLELDGVPFEVRHTHGHSPGGVSFYQPDAGVCFVGDTLFHDSIGRMDFPHSDGPRLMRSIREQLLTLPDATRVFAGHMISTTIGREKRENPFLQPGFEI